jgi:hypothetical protein
VVGRGRFELPQVSRRFYSPWRPFRIQNRPLRAETQRFENRLTGLLFTRVRAGEYHDSTKTTIVWCYLELEPNRFSLWGWPALVACPELEPRARDLYMCGLMLDLCWTAKWFILGLSDRLGPCG